jgi:hypothetical protein
MRQKVIWVFFIISGLATAATNIPHSVANLPKADEFRDFGLSVFDQPLLFRVFESLGENSRHEADIARKRLASFLSDWAQVDSELAAVAASKLTLQSTLNDLCGWLRLPTRQCYRNLLDPASGPITQQSVIFAEGLRIALVENMGKDEVSALFTRTFARYAPGSSLHVNAWRGLLGDRRKRQAVYEAARAAHVFLKLYLPIPRLCLLQAARSWELERALQLAKQYQTYDWFGGISVTAPVGEGERGLPSTASEERGMDSFSQLFEASAEFGFVIRIAGFEQTNYGMFYELLNRVFNESELSGVRLRISSSAHLTRDDLIKMGDWRRRSQSELTIETSGSFSPLPYPLEIAAKRKISVAGQSGVLRSIESVPDCFVFIITGVLLTHFTLPDPNGG